MTDQPSLLDPAAPGGSDGPPGARGGRRGSGDDDPRVRDVDIAERMERSFLDYSMSVIVGRALPDVRDGLKPVQRRILYAMWEGGLRPDRPHRKAASAVGDVMRKYHPHGDTSIYDALVRMAQDFAMRAPLVDGHGNFGSIDGDGAAAMRYTEARLSAVAMELLAGIDEDTVDYVANYDGREEEPLVLPSRFPNLLVNGASGIAVGMATAVPPHNLGETVDACLLLVERPEATVDELLEVLPGPDFPTGGRIVPGPGIRDAYLTGRGTITVEAVATTETRSGGLPRIIVTEIPYQVNKAALLERIAGLVKDRKLDEVRDLRDESSHEGLRVVVELKRGEDPARVLAKLYRLSDLRENFNANLVALTKPDAERPPQPRTLGLRDLLLAYVGHQRDVLTRRTTHRRDRAAARVHVLEGLLVALDHLDEVIALIRAADTVDDARTQLVDRYELTEVQATAILDMQLRRLAALERRRIADEHRELRALIDGLEAILADPGKLDGMLAEELRALRDRHADARRTRIATGDRPAEEGTLPAEGDEETLPELEAQPVTVYVTAAGYVKPVSSRRVSAPHTSARDPVVAVVRATTDATLLAVDADGGGYRIALADVPVVTMRQRGTSIGQVLGDGPDAPLVGAVALPAAESVMTVSAAGLVKRTERSEYTGRTRMMVATGVRDDDEIVGVVGCGDGDEVLLAHDGGQVIRFPATDVRPTGRGARGVAGLDVPDGHRVVAVSVVRPGADEQVVTLAADGGARRTPPSEYPTRGRGGKGVQAGAAPLAWCGVATDLHVPTDDGPVLLRGEQVAPGPRTGRLSPATAAVTGPVTAETSAG